MTDETMTREVAENEIRQFAKRVDVDFDALKEADVGMMVDEMVAGRLVLMDDTMRYRPHRSKDALAKHGVEVFEITEPTGAVLSEMASASKRAGGKAEEFHVQVAMNFAQIAKVTGQPRPVLEELTQREFTKLATFVGFFTGE